MVACTRNLICLTDTQLKLSSGHLHTFKIFEFQALRLFDRFSPCAEPVLPESVGMPDPRPEAPHQTMFAFYNLKMRDRA